MGNVAVVVTGLEQAEKDLSPEHFARAIATGFDEIGGAVQGYTAGRLGTHHWQGKLLGSLHHVTTGSGSIATEKTTISVEGPQARSFRGGWFSRSGHQPPTEQIAAWLSDHGKDPRFAFAVARKIGGRSTAAAAGRSSGLAGAALGRLGGYSFGKLRLFPTARWIKPRAVEIIGRALQIRTQVS